MSREASKKLLDLIESGMLDVATVCRDAINFMSEDEVRDFVQANDYFDPDEESEEEFEFTEESEVREAFAESWAESLSYSPEYANDKPAKRQAFTGFVDNLQRDGRISDDLANNVTLDSDD